MQKGNSIKVVHILEAVQKDLKREERERELYTITSPIWFTIIISNIICLLSNNKDHICAIISYTCVILSQVLVKEKNEEEGGK